MKMTSFPSCCSSCQQLFCSWKTFKWRWQRPRTCQMAPDSIPFHSAPYYAMAHYGVYHSVLQQLQLPFKFGPGPEPGNRGIGLETHLQNTKTAHPAFSHRTKRPLQRNFCLAVCCQHDNCQLRDRSSSISIHDSHSHSESHIPSSHQSQVQTMLAGIENGGIVEIGAWSSKLGAGSNGADRLDGRAKPRQSASQQDIQLLIIGCTDEKLTSLLGMFMPESVQELLDALCPWVTWHSAFEEDSRPLNMYANM